MMYTRIPYTAHMIGKVIYTSSLHQSYQSVRLWMIHMLPPCRKNCTNAFCDGSNCLDSFALDGAVRHGHVAPWSSTKANSGRNRWLNRWRVLKENKDSTFPNAWSENRYNMWYIYIYIQDMIMWTDQEKISTPFLLRHVYGLEGLPGWTHHSGTGLCQDITIPTKKRNIITVCKCRLRYNSNCQMMNLVFWNSNVCVWNWNSHSA